MGVSSYDKSEGTRKLEEMYDMTNANDVKRALKRRQHMKSQVHERGDFALCDFLADLDVAIALSGMNETERNTVRLYFVADYARADVAATLERDESTVQKAATSAVEKIAAVYRRWKAVEKGETTT